MLNARMRNSAIELVTGMVHAKAAGHDVIARRFGGAT
jgi:hypothetical protein